MNIKLIRMVAITILLITIAFVLSSSSHVDAQSGSMNDSSASQAFTYNPNASSSIVFSDDFSGDLSQWTVQVGDWAIENGELIGTGWGGSIDASIYAGDISWDDYSLSAKIDFIEGNAGLYLRSTGHWQNEYRVDFWLPNVVEIVRYQDGIGVSYGYQPCPETFTDPLNARVEIINDTLTVYVNNSYCVSFTDPNPLPNGRIGLNVIWSESAYFDDVSVDSVHDCDVGFLWQRDPRWRKYPLLTTGICDPNCGVIGNCGCTLTSANMLFNFYGASLTPDTLSDCMSENACPFNWWSGASCSNGKAEWVDRYSFSYSRLDQELNQNKRPVILGMHRVNKPEDTHWVLVVSGQGDDASGYLMHDPWFEGGANMSLSTRSKDYVFDWISVYAGQSSCNVVFLDASTSLDVKPISLQSSGEVMTENDLFPTFSYSSEISSTTTIYRMTEITMTLHLSATSTVGNITDMLVWTDTISNTTWQPFSTFVWLPVGDVVYVMYRDEYDNVSEVTTDTIFPVNTPATLDVFDDFLPIILKE